MSALNFQFTVLVDDGGAFDMAVTETLLLLSYVLTTSLVSSKLQPQILISMCNTDIKLYT